jgi:hypothetical protein
MQALLQDLDSLSSALQSRDMLPKQGNSFVKMAGTLRALLTSDGMITLLASQCVSECCTKISLFFGCLRQFLLGHATKPERHHLTKSFEDIKQGSEMISGYATILTNWKGTQNQLVIES